jgi:hypothetical protein
MEAKVLLTWLQAPGNAAEQAVIIAHEKAGKGQLKVVEYNNVAQYVRYPEWDLVPTYSKLGTGATLLNVTDQLPAHP